MEEIVEMVKWVRLKIVVTNSKNTVKPLNNINKNWKKELAKKGNKNQFQY